MSDTDWEQNQNFWNSGGATIYAVVVTVILIGVTVALVVVLKKSGTTSTNKKNVKTKSDPNNVRKGGQAPKVKGQTNLPWNPGRIDVEDVEPFADVSSGEEEYQQEVVEEEEFDEEVNTEDENEPEEEEEEE